MVSKSPAEGADARMASPEAKANDSRGEEDCKNLFFQCPFTCTIWATQWIASIEVTSEMTFQDSIWQCGLRRKEERRRILVVLWAAWLHRNVVLFRGRSASTDGVADDVEGLMASWFHCAS